MQVGRASSPLYLSLGEKEGQSWIENLCKALGSEDGASNQVSLSGVRGLPFNIPAIKKLSISNPHHAACIRAKRASTVGMGFVTDGDTDENMEPARRRKLRSKAARLLDPLCRVSFQDVIDDVDEEVWQVGNGYMEVVRASEGEKITGIYHVPANDIRIYVEQNGLDWHYEQSDSEGGTPKKFARFGDLEDFRARMNIPGDQRVAEIIHFRLPSSHHRWYGYPDWLAAVSSMELSSCLHQHTHDFFLNRGVPEFILFLLGRKIDGDNWKRIENSMKAHIGKGNSHKSMVLNLTDTDMKVQLEKLALEGKTDSKDFSSLADALALEVVSSHGVPPLLAGIQIPGKLGATNELPNALRAFQLLLIGPAQRSFTTTLDCTLGDPDLNGGLGLTEGDFVLRAITDELDLEQMATSASMRQTEPEAAAQGRDLDDGLRD